MRQAFVGVVVVAGMVRREQGEISGRRIAGLRSSTCSGGGVLSAVTKGSEVIDAG